MGSSGRGATATGDWTTEDEDMVGTNDNGEDFGSKSDSEPHSQDGNELRGRDEGDTCSRAYRAGERNFVSARVHNLSATC